MDLKFDGADPILITGAEKVLHLDSRLALSPRISYIQHHGTKSPLVPAEDFTPFYLSHYAFLGAVASTAARVFRSYRSSSRALHRICE